jgi:hypothetical protein
MGVVENLRDLHDQGDAAAQGQWLFQSPVSGSESGQT